MTSKFTSNTSTAPAALLRVDPTDLSIDNAKAMAGLSGAALATLAKPEAMPGLSSEVSVKPEALARRRRKRKRRGPASYGAQNPALAGVAPLVVSPAVARRLLSISVATLYQLLNASELTSYRAGASRKILVSSIEDFIRRRVAAVTTNAVTGAAMPRGRGRPRS